MVLPKPAPYKRGGGQRQTLRARVENFRGLDLESSAAQLEATQSSVAMNVDIDPRGGIRTRRGLLAVTTSVRSTDRAWKFESFVGGATADRAVAFTYAMPQLPPPAVPVPSLVSFPTNGSTTSTVVLALNPPLVYDAIQFAGKFYTVHGDSPSMAGDATTASGHVALTNNFDDSPQTPTTGNMPKARVVAAWRDCVWVADVTETVGGRNVNRVRFSWPGTPEMWGTDNYLDIDPGRDGDGITALMPHGDRLLVFKKNSTYAIVGSEGIFEYVSVSPAAGAVARGAVARDSNITYAFDSEYGLWAVGPSGAPNTKLFHPFQSILREKAVAPTTTTVARVRNRIWVGLVDVLGHRSSLVLDTLTGVWTQADYRTTEAFEVAANGSVNDTWWGIVESPSFQATPYGASQFWASPWVAQLADLEVGNVDAKGSMSVPIQAEFRSGWMDGGEQAAQKNFKRTHVVHAGQVVATVGRNWRWDQVSSPAILAADATADSSSVWGSAVWGSSLWSASDATEKWTVGRSNPGGRANALAVKFTGAAPWRVAGYEFGFDKLTRRG
jgi:hypothetical protein